MMLGALLVLEGGLMEVRSRFRDKPQVVTRVSFPFAPMAGTYLTIG